MVEYHLFLPKTCRNCINSVQKSCQEKFSVILHAVRIWKGDILVANIEELEKMDASEIHARRFNAKEVSTHQKGEKRYLSDRRWNSRMIQRRSGSENIHLNLGQPRPRRRTRTSSGRIRRVFTNTFSRLIAE